VRPSSSSGLRRASPERSPACPARNTLPQSVCRHRRSRRAPTDRHRFAGGTAIASLAGRTHHRCGDPRRRLDRAVAGRGTGDSAGWTSMLLLATSSSTTSGSRSCLSSSRSLAITPADTVHLRATPRRLWPAFSTIVPGRRRYHWRRCWRRFCGAAERTISRAMAALPCSSWQHTFPATRCRSLLPEARSWTRPRRVKLSLHGRHDSAQHLSSQRHSPPGRVSRQRMRSASTRKCVTRAAAVASRSPIWQPTAPEPASASSWQPNSPRLQAAVQRPLSDSDLAPSLAGLPEGLSAAEFERRFAAPESVRATVRWRAR
jgi:hypothetical protein